MVERFPGFCTYMGFLLGFLGRFLGMKKRFVCLWSECFSGCLFIDCLVIWLNIMQFFIVIINLNSCLNILNKKIIWFVNIISETFFCQLCAFKTIRYFIFKYCKTDQTYHISPKKKIHSMTRSQNILAETSLNSIFNSSVIREPLCRSKNPPKGSRKDQNRLKKMHWTCVAGHFSISSCVFRMSVCSILTHLNRKFFWTHAAHIKKSVVWWSPNEYIVYLKNPKCYMVLKKSVMGVFQFGALIIIYKLIDVLYWFLQFS